MMVELKLVKIVGKWSRSSSEITRIELGRLKLRQQSNNAHDTV